MSELIPSKTPRVYEQKPLPGWKPPASPMARANKLAETLLNEIEKEMNAATSAAEKFDTLFGPKGLMGVLPKLIQLIKGLEPEGEASDEGMTHEDIAVLKEWLALKAD